MACHALMIIIVEIENFEDKLQYRSKFRMFSLLNAQSRINLNLNVDPNQWNS